MLHEGCVSSNYVSDAFSAPIKPVNEYVISPTLDVLGTGIRRTLRDDCRFSQVFAQDAGDMSSFVVCLLIPCRIVKAPGKITKLKAPDRVAQRKIENVGKYWEFKKVHHSMITSKLIIFRLKNLWKNMV